MLSQLRRYLPGKLCVLGRLAQSLAWCLHPSTLAPADDLLPLGGSCAASVGACGVCTKGLGSCMAALSGLLAAWLPAGEWTEQTAELLETGTVSMQRPGTVDRQNGRVAMTVLHAHHHLQEEVDAVPSTADPARGDPSKWAGQTVGLAVSSCLCPAACNARCTAAGPLHPSAASADTLEGPLASARASQNFQVSSLQSSNNSVRRLQGQTLRVVMAPQRARTTICFAERGVAQVDHGTVPRLTVFEHVPGARVFSDLFPDYRLPNGMKAFCYYDAGACLPFLWHWGLLHIHTACKP